MTTSTQTTQKKQPPMVAFARLTKVDEEKRLVYGRITQEVPDRTGEMLDYAASKPYFERWSASQLQASMGKSAGNVRGMHSKVAAGKVVPENGLIFNDAEKAIDVVAYVSDDGEFRKCLDGTYTGYSIGGSYVSKSKPDKDTGVVTYVCNPVEVSLVDRPAVPTATFFEVQKADGSVEKREFVKVETIELVRPGGASFGVAVEKALVPEELGAEFKSGDRTFTLLKREGMKAEVEEIFEIAGSPEEIGAFAKVLVGGSLSISDATLLLKAALDAAEPAPEVLGAAVLELAKADGLVKEKMSLDELKKALGEGDTLEGLRARARAQIRGQSIAKAFAPAPGAAEAVDLVVEAYFAADGLDPKSQKAADLRPPMRKAVAAAIAAQVPAQAAAPLVKKFADKDGQRFPIDTSEQVQAAHFYAGMLKAGKDSRYTEDQIKAIRSSIADQAKALGVQLEPVEETEKAITARATELAKAAGADAKPETYMGVARVERLAKGLYSCGRLAELVDSLCYLADSVEFEAMQEGDGSTICDELYGAVTLLGSTLQRMVAEEVAEATKAAIAPKVEALTKVLAKASHTAVSVKRIQKMHDMAKGMGAACETAKAAGAAAAEAGAVAAAQPSAVQKAAAAELEKSASQAGATYVDKAAEADALQKAIDAAVQKTVAAEVEKALAPVRTELAAEKAKVAKLEAQPLQSKITLRAVDKAEDGGRQLTPQQQKAAEIAASIEPVMKADGSGVDEAATAMKIALRMGGQSVTQSVAPTRTAAPAA